MRTVVMSLQWHFVLQPRPTTAGHGPRTTFRSDFGSLLIRQSRILQLRYPPSKARGPDICTSITEAQVASVRFRDKTTVFW